MCGDLSATHVIQDASCDNDSSEVRADSGKKDVREKCAASKTVSDGSAVDFNAVYQDICQHGF